MAANLVLFAALWGQFFAEPRYPNIDRLVQVWATGTAGRLQSWAYPVRYEAAQRIRERSTTLGEVALTQGHLVPLELAGEAAQDWIQEVTPNYYDVLGVRPWLGRGFTPDDAADGAPGVAILTFATWRARFGADSSIVGRQIRIRGVPHTIIGVLPEGIGEQPVHVPFRFDSHSRDAREQHVAITALLATGRTRAEAHAEMRALGRMLVADSLLAPDRVLEAESPAYFSRRSIGGPGRVLLLFAPPLALLITACFNVAGMILARSAGRQHELAVRSALGADQWRLVREPLLECLALASLGLALALVLTRWSTDGFLRGWPVRFDLAFVLVAAALVVVTVLASGVVPALWAARIDPHQALRTTGGGITTGRLFRRVRGSLIVIQSAACLCFSALLIIYAAGMWRTHRAGLGFDPTNVVTFTSRVPATSPSRDDALAFRTAALPALSSVAGVEGAAMSATMVVTSTDPVSLEEERPSMPAATHGSGLRVSMVTRDYFRVLGVPVLRGRAISAEEERTLAPVAVINAPAAERWFGSHDPVGQRIRIDSLGSGAASWLTIVGVVGGVRNEPLFQRVPPPAIYTSALLWVPESFDVVVTSTAGPAVLAPLVARAMSGLTLDARPRLESLARRMRRESSTDRLQVQVTGAAAVFTVTLTLIGLYGLVRLTTEQRRRELGVRAALGASRARLVRLILSEAVALVVAGAVAGTIIAMVVIAVTRSAGGTGMGIAFLATSAAGIVLTLVAAAACYPLARRAAATSPMESLRIDS